MSNTNIKPVAAAVGFALVGSLSVANLANAADNPFGATQLNGGYLQVAAAEGKCGAAGSAATEKKAEGKCGGASMSAADKKAAEGKCGEGKCGAAGKAAAEGKCGGDKKAGEGKCGGAK